MNKGAIEIGVDSASLANFNKQMDYLKKTGVESAFKAICTVALKIRTYAMLHLQSQGHIITSRLKNSIFVKAKKQSEVNINGNSPTYSAGGKTYNADLKSVTLSDNEVAVGSNVAYAATIEKGSQPHVIEVKNAKVLGNPKVGFFGKRVNHPGFKGDSFLDYALKNVDVAKSTADLMREEMAKRTKK